jgi:hypothetical protein
MEVRRNRNAYLGLALALAVGGFCRLWDLGGKSLFIDEGWVFHISSMAAREIPDAVAHTDFHPPLFYLVTHYLSAALGWPPWDYRYFTAIFSLFGIAATWSLARRFFGDTAAWIAGLAMAVQPALVEWDRLYRMYAVLVALTAVSWWLLVRALDAGGKNRWLWWAVYWASAILLPYVHYVGAVVVLSQAIYAVAMPRARWPAFIGQAAAAVALVPWIWAIRVQFPNGGLVRPVDWSIVWFVSLVRSTLVSGTPARWLLLPGFDTWFAIAAVTVGVAGVYVGRRSIVPYWLSPIALHVAASAALHKNLLIPRYLYPYVPAYCLALAALCAYLWATRYRVGVLAIGGAYFALAAASVANILFVPFYQPPDWYAVNDIVLLNERRSDIFVLDQGAEYWVVHDYSAFRGHEVEAPAIPSDVAPTIRWLAGYPKRRVWYIENQPEFTDSNHRIKAALDATRKPLRAWLQEREFRDNAVLIILYGPKKAVKKAS